MSAPQSSAPVRPAWLRRVWPARTVLLACLIMPVIQYGLAQVSFALSLQDGAAAVWPTAGFYLAAVLLLGQRIWPALLLSELVSNSVFYKSPWAIGLVSVASLIDPLVNGFLVNRLIKTRNILSQAQHVLKFVGLIPLIHLLNGLLAIAILCSLQEISWDAYWTSWRIWSFGAALSSIIVTPALLAWWLPAREIGRFQSRQIPELALLVGLMIGICRLAFWQGFPIEYMLVPPLVWATFRFTQREATFLVVGVSAIAVFGTAQGQGTFAQVSSSEALILLQSFMGVIALTTFVLLAII
jgi:integral membrane sensor domain MASE1